MVSGAKLLNLDARQLINKDGSENVAVKYAGF